MVAKLGMRAGRLRAESFAVLAGEARSFGGRVMGRALADGIDLGRWAASIRHARPSPSIP